MSVCVSVCVHVSVGVSACVSVYVPGYNFPHVYVHAIVHCPCLNLNVFLYLHLHLHRHLLQYPCLYTNLGQCLSYKRRLLAQGSSPTGEPRQPKWATGVCDFVKDLKWSAQQVWSGVLLQLVVDRRLNCDVRSQDPKKKKKKNRQSSSEEWNGKMQRSGQKISFHKCSVLLQKNVAKDAGWKKTSGKDAPGWSCGSGWPWRSASPTMCVRILRRMAVRSTSLAIFKLTPANMFLQLRSLLCFFFSENGVLTGPAHHKTGDS